MFVVFSSSSDPPGSLRDSRAVTRHWLVVWVPSGVPLDRGTMYPGRMSVDPRGGRGPPGPEGLFSCVRDVPVEGGGVAGSGGSTSRRLTVLTRGVNVSRGLDVLPSPSVVPLSGYSDQNLFPHRRRSTSSSDPVKDQCLRR